MLSYKALSRASITLQKIEENSSYSCEIFSSNGSILQPYDVNTTLTGVVYNNFKDVTKEISNEDIKWTIWNERNNELFKKEWNNSHAGKNPITISCDEINGKAIIQFEIYKTNKFGLKELITCNRITLIDINDLMATATKPTNPYENQLWIDTSIVPATLLIWQNKKWNMVGTVTTIIKNLIRNSNFINYSYEPFDIIGNTKNQYMPVVKTISGRKWLNIKSDVSSNEDKGISQITEKEEKINKNSKYSFQFLAYASFENTTSYNNSIEVRISSIDKYNIETILYHGGINKEITLNKNACKFFTSFDTLLDTEKIKIEILGKSNFKYDFNITQLALYNTDNDYPWQSHPDDTSNILDSESIFNAFTNNGKIQGIFSAIDPITGQVQYYFNAEYIKSGTIKGNLIDAKNLVVTNKNNEKTLHIDEDGNVYLTVSSLIIGSTNQNIEDFINTNQNSSTEMLDSMLLQIEKDYTVTNYVYNEIYNNLDFQLLEFNGDISSWLKLEDRPEAKIIKYMDLLFYVNKAYEKTLENLKESIVNSKTDYENNKNLLNYNYNEYSKKIGIINKLFVNCSSYLSNAKIETVNDSWSQIKIDLGGITTDVGNLKETYTIQDERVTSVESDLHSVKQEITPEAISSKVQNIVKTDEEVTKYIETIASQTAQGFNQVVIDQLNGDFSRLEQNVKGMTETFSSDLTTVIKKQSDGIYISISDQEDDVKSLVTFDSEKVLISSSNIDLNGYVTITSLSDPNSTTIIDGNLIETDTLSANKVKTGKLQGKNSNSYFNLDDGTFSLANSTQTLMTFNGTSLSFQNDVNYNLDKDDFSNNLDWIKTWTEGATVINSKQVLSPRAFFGTVNVSKQATGISLGGTLNEIYKTEGIYNGIDSGIAGYYEGIKTFHFKTDGTLLIGKDTTGNHISWDGNNLSLRASNINIGLQSVATNTDIASAINGLELKFKNNSGYNLIRNSTGANGNTNGWTHNASSMSTGVNNLIDSICKTYLYLDNGVTTSERFAYSSRFKLKPNTKYTLTGYFHNYTTCPSFDVWLLSSTVLNETNISTDYTNIQILIGGQNTNNVWKKFTTTITTPDNTLSGYIRIDNNGYNSNGTGANRVHWNALIFSEGELEVPWSSHPSEIYDGITFIDRDGITVTASNVKSKTTMSANGFKITKVDIDGNDDVFSVNNDGTLNIKGNINGGSINLNNNFKVDSSGNVITAGNVTLGGTITANGNITATNLSLTGGFINLGNGKFTVDNLGSVTANSLVLTGGSIDINSGKFIVDAEGNVTTAGRVIISSEATVPSSTLTGTISSSQLDSTINNTLTNADSNNTLISNNNTKWTTAYSQVTNWATATPTGTTEFNGNRIKTGTIFADKIALGDFTNYAELNADTLSKWGFVSVADSTASNNPWFKKSTISRDNPISKYYKCNGGESLRIIADISTTIYGQSVSEGTATATARSVGIMIFAKTNTGTTTYYTNNDLRVTATSTSTATIASINSTVKLDTNIREFAVYIQIEGYPTFTGELKVRNVLVSKMSTGELIVNGTITTEHINTTGLNASVIKAGTISAERLDANTIVSKVNGATTTIDGNMIRTGQLVATTGGSYLDLDNGSMMLGATSSSNYLQWTGSALNIKASTLSIGGTTAATTSNVSAAKTDAINEAVGVKDNRSTNEAPSWYMTNYPKRTIQELKSLSAIGLTGTSTYGIVETKIPWIDSSGGYPIQTFFGEGSDMFVRKGISNTTWSEWTRKVNANQDDVLNSLTNNGADEGIYLLNNKLYVNASSIKAGTLDAELITTENLEGKTIKGGTISGGEININDVFKVDSAGKMIATGAEITGKITVSTDSSVPTSTLSGTVSSSQLDPTINTSISTANTNATNANNKIDGLSIGGRNLLSSSNKFNKGTGATGVTSVLNSDGTLSVTSTSGNSNWFNAWPISYGIVEETLMQGDSFTISFTMKSSNTTSKPTVYIKSGMEYYNLIGTMSSNWSILYYTGTWVKANSMSLNLGFSGVVGTIDIKNWKIEKGNKPTDWIPSLEETAIKVEKMYYQSTSSTSQTGGSWSTTLPTVAANKFIWTKTITIFAAGNTSETTPILYQPEWIQDWDSTKTTITGTSVLAPKIFAGTKETDNTATGVAIGSNVFGTGTDFSGIAGYKSGVKTYHFKTDGSFLIGKDTTNNNISWDGSNLNIKASSINIGTEDVKTYMDKTSAQISQNKQNIRCNDLGAKINYSTFSTANPGEIYLHGYDSNNNPTDTNGTIYWNGTALTITKGMVNPNGDFGTNDCYLCTDLSGGTFVAYYSDGWKYKWLIGSTTNGDLNIGDNYICFGQFKMNDDESFQYAYLHSNPIKLESIIGVSNYITTSTLTQTSNNIIAKFTQSGGTNLLKNSSFKNGYANWNYLRWDSTAGGNAYIEIVYPQYNEWTPGNRNSLGACITGLPASSSGMLIRSGFDSDEFTIKSSTTYSLNCLMASHRIRSYTIEMLCYDASGNRLTDNNHSVVIDSPKSGGRDRNNWNKIKHTWTTQSNAVTCNLRAYMNEWDGNYDSAYLWICEPIIAEGDVDIPWTANADEVYTGIVTLDNEGVLVDMIDGAISKGYSRLSHEGITTYDSNEQIKSWFSDDSAFIEKLTVNDIDNPYIIQCKPRTTSWYVGQNITGDGTGRNSSNKANSIQSVLEYIRNTASCYIYKQDINIYCDNGINLNENLYIGGWIGSGVIKIGFGTNSTFTGYIRVEECMPLVILDGGSTGWGQNDGCKWYREDGNPSNAALYSRRSNVLCRHFRSHRGNGLTDYGNTFAYADSGSFVTLYNNDLVKYYDICRCSSSSTIYVNSIRGDVGVVSDVCDSSTIVANAYLPIFNTGKQVNNSWCAMTQLNGEIGYNSLWYPKNVATPAPTPTQSWHWVEKTFYFNLSSVTEGTGSTTSGWSGKWGQGKWSSYKPHRGHAKPTESISTWCNVSSNTRNISMVLTMTRLNTSHGYPGAVPIPKLKQKDGTYWNSGVAFAQGNTKSISLSSGIISGLSDGTLSELTMWAGTSTNDYSQYNNTTLTVTCEKYY